jgi:hypothetical protein
MSKKIHTFAIDNKKYYAYLEGKVLEDYIKWVKTRMF